ncbi:unnamed protein product [Ectocarpus sp. CCAP 1310/34]|nr:unnamed protein product [Ectocarpus sp. CCAP 1310/34]
MPLQAHTTKFMVDQLKYTSLVNTRRTSSGIFRSANLAKTPARFGSFDDSIKYGGAVPSEHYLRDMWRLYLSKLPVLEVDSVDWTLEEYQHRLMQRWDGDILGGDASFKFAKIIRLGAKAGEERTRPVYGFFTVFNECEQLPKDTVRCSRWGSAQLSVEQRDCAIRDAVASALFYEAIHTNKDPITSVPSSPFDPAVGLKVSAYALWYRPYFDVDRQQQIMAGSKFVLKPKQQRLPSFFCPLRVLQVRLYNASHSACVAVGHVVSDATAETALRHWQSSAKLQGVADLGWAWGGGGGGGADGVAAVQGLHRMRTPQGCIPC